MGQGQSAAEDLHRKKKDELAQMMKVLDAKRDQFQAEVFLKRGKNISDKEVSGGRSVVRQSAIRVATQASPSQQIKKGIGNFFEAAQGGNKGKKAMVKGATQLVSGAIDAIFGVSKGSGMEKRGFTVLFLNFAFVRTDYFVYSYCAFGEKWGCQNSVSGSVQVTDMAVLDPATLHPMEINYLIAQNITIESNNEKVMDNPEFEALMQIKVMLATSSVLTRIMQDPETDFQTLKITMDQIRQIMDALAGKIGELPDFDEDEVEKLLAVSTENWLKISVGKHDEIKDKDGSGKDTKALTKRISKTMALNVWKFIVQGCPPMSVVDSTNKYGFKTDKTVDGKSGGSAYDSTKPNHQESTELNAKHYGLGLSPEQWDDPEELLNLFNVEWLEENPDFDEVKNPNVSRFIDIHDDSKCKYRPEKKDEEFKDDESTGSGSEDAAVVTTVQATDPKDIKYIERAEMEARALIIKQQLIAQFRRNTYDNTKGKYTKFMHLQEFQQVGVKVLFGFEEAEWDVYYPTFKAPGRDEMAYDPRTENADKEVWKTW